MSRLVRAAFLGILLGTLGVAVSFFHFGHDIEENVGLGLLFKLRGVRKAPSDVVVVTIDRESSESLQVSDNPDRWPRTLHARLLEKLTREGVQVVVFDVYFLEPRPPAEDNSFAGAIEKARNVVLAEPLKTAEVITSDPDGSYAAQHRLVRILKPIPLLAQSAVATAPFVLPRLPVKVSQYWTFQTGAGDSPTFPVVAFQLYALQAYDEFIRLLEKVSPNRAKLPPDAETAVKTRGARRFIRDIREIFERNPSITPKMVEALEQSGLAAIDGNKYRLLKSLINLYGSSNRRYLNYYGPPRTLTTIPYHKMLRLGEDSGSDGLPDLKGKAVFVGLSEILLTEKKDSFYTVFSQDNGVFISGVEIAATAFLNLLEDAAVKPINSQSYILTILVWGILMGVICGMFATLVAAVAILALSFLYLFAAEFQFAADGTWYPIVIPLFVQTPLAFFSALLWNYFALNKERQNLRKVLGYYAPSEVVDELAKNIIDLKRGDQTVYGACLFTDAAGYTTLSERMAVRELNEFVGRYHKAMYEQVKQNGGRVIDLAGDAMLAIWKAAGPETGLSKQVCDAALRVAQAVSQFNQSPETINLPTRVGAHVGQIFLGNIGTDEDYRYGAQGDTVNTASRLESLNKQLGTQILVSEDVVYELDGFLTREVGKFRLKGKAQPVVAYELLCRIEEAGEEQIKACAIFSQALHAFRQQSWEQAKEKFHQFIEHSRTDDLGRFYLRLCAQYQENPPNGTWEGIISMEDK